MAAAVVLSGCTSLAVPGGRGDGLHSGGIDGTLDRLAEGTLPGPGGVADYFVSVEGELAHGFVGVPVTGSSDVLLVIAHPMGAGPEWVREKVQLWAQRGVWALGMDYRGEAGTYKVRAAWQDTLAATIQFKQEHPEVRKTLAWGWSLGGQATALAIAYGPPGTFDYWFDGAGVMDLRTQWAEFVLIGAVPGNNPIERETGGTPLTVPDVYSALSPIDQVDKIAAHGLKRAFIVHAAGDTIVTIQQAERMYDALVQAGVPTSFYTVTTGRDTWTCARAGVVCPAGAADHEAGDKLDVFIEHRIDGWPDPAEPAVRGFMDTATGTYAPAD